MKRLKNIEIFRHSFNLNVNFVDLSKKYI